MKYARRPDGDITVMTDDMRQIGAIHRSCYNRLANEQRAENMAKATVFVVQENNRIDYSDAERFGDIRFITAEEFKPVKGSLRNLSILDSIRVHMESFNPEHDCLVMTGNPITMGYVFHLALQKSPIVKCLQWDRFNGEYREVVFDSRAAQPQIA